MRTCVLFVLGLLVLPSTDLQAQRLSANKEVVEFPAHTNTAVIENKSCDQTKFGDDPPPDWFEVMIKFNRGRLVSDRGTAKVCLSEQFSRRLRAGVTDAQLIELFCDALDREFKLMPKPYFFTLTDKEKRQDLAGNLDKPEVNNAREWNGGWRQFPRLREFVEDPTPFNIELDKISTRSPLIYLAPNEDDDFSRLPRMFRVRDVFLLDEVTFPVLQTRILDESRIRRLLRPLAGLPADPDRIRTSLLDFYSGRDVTPRIDLELDQEPRKISVFDGDRIARLLLPGEVMNFEVAERIVYETMPDRLFRAFRKKGRAIMAQPMAEGAKKRTIDLSQLVLSAEGREKAKPLELPFLDPDQLQQQQQRLLMLGFQASLFDFDSSRRMVDLVIDKTTPQEGAATDSNRFLGTAETAENTSNTSFRPGSESDLQPTTVAPAAPPAGELPANTPRREKRNFIGGGIEYKPGQGARLFGTGHRLNLAGRDLLSIEAGGQGSGFGTGNYSRDYIGFDALGRRLSFDFNGGTEFEQRRILGSVLTDERRTGAALRVELESFRDRRGNQLVVWLEGRRETVRLMPTGNPERASNLTTLDFGASHRWSAHFIRHPGTIRLEPSLRLGLGVSSTEPRFQRFHLNSAFHQLITRSLEVDIQLHTAFASSSTPLFELPSLGGDESVRGFRADDAIGKRLWSVQNEIWKPLWPGSSSSKFQEFLNRKVRLAGLYDLGGLYSPSGVQQGFRQGIGAGLRIRHQGVVLALSWAYGLGNGASGKGRGRTYFTVRLP